MSYLSYMREFNGPDGAILRDPKRYMPLVAFLEETTRQKSEINLHDRERLASYVSNLNASPFCVGIHDGVADAINGGLSENAEADSGKFPALLTLAKALITCPDTFGVSEVQAVLDAGWSEQAVEDVIGLVASVTVYNIMSVGLGFKTAPDGYFEGLGHAVKEHGYLDLFKSMLTDSQTT